METMLHTPDQAPAPQPRTNKLFITPRRRGAEYFDTVLWRLKARVEGEPTGGALLGFLGAGRRNGVSTVAANVAIRAADHRESPVLLVDANLHRPQQHRSFRLGEAAGLVDVLAGAATIEEATHATTVERLDVMPVGDAGLLDRTSVSTDHCQALLKQLREEYRTVVFDLGCVEGLHHSLLLAQAADVAVMVIRSENVRRREAEDAVAQLKADGVRLAGSVLTGKKSYAPSWLKR